MEKCDIRANAIAKLLEHDIMRIDAQGRYFVPNERIAQFNAVNQQLTDEWNLLHEGYPARQLLGRDQFLNFVSMESIEHVEQHQATPSRPKGEYERRQLVDVGVNPIVVKTLNEEGGEVQGDMNDSIAQETFTDGQDLEIEGLDGVDIDSIGKDFSNFYNALEYLIQQSEQLLSDLDSAIENTSDPKEIERLMRQRELIHLRLTSKNGLRAVKERLRKDPTTFNFQFLMYIKDMEIKYVEMMLSSNPTERQLLECESTLHFWLELGNFTDSKRHILWDVNELYNESGELTIPSTVKEQLEAIRLKAQDLQRSIDQRKRKIVADLVASDSRFKPLIGEVKGDTAEERQKNIYEQIEKTMLNPAAMRDISLFDRWFIDPASLSFGEDNPLGQKMVVELLDRINEKAVEAARLSDRLSRGRVEVETILRGMGYRLPNSSRGADWNFFRAVDEFGNITAKMRERFTVKWKIALRELREEQESQTRRIMREENPYVRESLRRNACAARKNWIRGNALLIDPRRIADLFNDSDLKATFERQVSKEDAEYVEQLKELLGEGGYQELIRRYKKRLMKYEAARTVKLNLLHELCGGADAPLDEDATMVFNDWVRNNDPFLSVDMYESEDDFTSTLTYTEMVPRASDSRGNPTGYYDAEFQKIEENPKLLEYYNAMQETLRFCVSNLPAKTVEIMMRGDIPSIQRSAHDILLQSDIPLFARLLAAFKRLLQQIKENFAEDGELSISYGTNDPATGRAALEVNDAWLRSHQRMVITDIAIAMAELRHFNEGRNVPPSMDITKASPEFLRALAERLGCAADLASIKSRLNGADLTRLNVRDALESALVANGVANDTKDLPKILQVFASQAAAYGAKRESVDRIAIMKEMYNATAKAKSTGSGRRVTTRRRLDSKKEEVALVASPTRSNAVARMDDWFNRVVLGITKHSDDFGGTDMNGRESSSAKGRMDRILNRATGKVLNDEEKQTRSDLRNAIRQLREDIENAKSGDSANDGQIARMEQELDFLERRDQVIGKQVSITSIVRGIMRVCHLRGLGWNPKSVSTNFLQGQLSNTIAAMSGKYFRPEDYYRAAGMVRGNNVKWLSGGKVSTRNADKISVWMQRTNILQDSSNELQRSSMQSSMAKLKEKSNPYYLTRSVEFLNQAPVAIAILMGTEIVGKDGTKSNVFDAMDENMNLLPNFDTEENRENWVHGRGQAYKSYMTRTTEVISLIHGNYHELLGMSSGEYMTSSAIMMFKRWLPNFIRQRIGTETHSGMLGQTEKGFYRSMTAGSGSLLFGLMGFLTMGPLGVALGGLVGGFIGRKFGVASDISYGQDLLLSLRNVAVGMVGRPMNLVRPGSARMMSDEKMMSYYGKQEWEDEFGRKHKGFNVIDAQNQRALATEIGMVALMIMLKLAAGMVLSGDDDDDDEEKAAKQAAFNAAFNMLNDVQNQSFLIANPLNLVEQASPAIVTFCNNTIDVFKKIQESIDGTPRLSSGYNAGNYKAIEAAKKVLPVPLDMRLGFSSAMRRIYASDYIDEMFVPAKQKQREAYVALRHAVRNDLLEKYPNRRKKDIERMVDRQTKKYRPK